MQYHKTIQYKEMKKIYSCLIIFMIGLLITPSYAQIGLPEGSPPLPPINPGNPIGPIGPIDPGPSNFYAYRDADNDSWGDPDDKVSHIPILPLPVGYVRRAGDCNDGDANINPDTIWYLDFDRDGYGDDQRLIELYPFHFFKYNYPIPDELTQLGTPNNPVRDWTIIDDTIYKGCSPPNDYVYSYVNGDCDNKNDKLYPNKKWYRDGDNDSFGIDSDIKTQCIQPEGYVARGGDCDDGNDQLNPEKIWYLDSDGDGWGVGTAFNNPNTKRQCTQPEGYVSRYGDCDDSKKDWHPEQIWYRDGDNDGWGSTTNTKVQCTPPNGYILKTGDCNDHRSEIHPETIWYVDVDYDGLGEERETKQQCAKPEGFALVVGDECPTVPGLDNGCPIYSPPHLSDKNYIYTRTPQAEITNISQIRKRNEVIEEITYFDDFGREEQRIGVKQSPTYKDVIQHVEYNKIGRQDKEYLPHIENNGSLSGSYRKANQSAASKLYYKTNYPDDFEDVAIKNVNSYSENKFERSPLARLQKIAAPGKDWALGNGHEIKFEHVTNDLNEVQSFIVTVDEDFVPSLNTTITYYPKGSLLKAITKDENWISSLDHTTEEFKDKQGRVILKRTYNENVPHDTYYVYDNFGNLSFTLPPKVVIDDGVSQTELDELCFQYRHDYRNRPIERKIPGKGWEYTIYNKLDQVIMTQDAEQRSSNEWLFTKYDALGREAYTGKIIVPNKTRDQIQQEVNDFTAPLWVERGTAVMIGEATMYYNNGGYPNVQNEEVLTIFYYDDYTFLASEDNFFNNPATVYGEAVSSRTKTLVTGSKVKVLGTSYWTTTATYYDKKARPIYVVSKNTYLETTDIVESKLDFVGKIERTKTTHTKGNNAAIVTEDTFEYDHMGRSLKQTQTINGQEETIAENTYDELGQLISKITGGGLQTIDYTYNIRGWMTKINNPTNLGNDLFSYGVNYANPAHGGTAMYNGNISETEWKTANDNVLRWYSYSYDPLDRITRAISNDGKYDLSLIEYDKIGNITKLQRKGHLNEAATSFGMMDNLTYTYHNGGNKLKAVVDAITQPFGFKKSSTAITTNQYSYDDNGNMLVDPNKGITGINYNHLNLPQTVSIINNTHNGNIQYVYDATGTKLRKTTTEGNASIITDYAGNYTYKNGVLEFFNHAEGYVEPSNNNGFDHVYQFKDHLGNIRLSYADNDSDGKIDIVRNNVDIDGDSDLSHEIREEKNYYPHGLVQKGYNFTIRGRKHNYGFGGKEENGELGLDWIDFSARNYDPTIGRWMNIDPLAEQMRRYTPYNYAFNNPVYYIDPDGMSPFDNYTINADGSILRQKTDDKTDTFTYVDEGGTSHEIGTFDKNDDGLIQLEDIDYSSGDTEVKVTGKPGNEDRSHVSGSAMASLIGASADSGEEIYVVSASKSDGSSPPPSVSHKKGKNLDIRYAGNNGSRNSINYKNSKTNFDKIDQTASGSMNASLKKFGWKDIKSSKLTITNTTTTTGADGKEVTNTTSNTYSVSGTKHLKNHYDHEHLQGYRPNVTTRTLQTPINLQSLPPVSLSNQ